MATKREKKAGTRSVVPDAKRRAPSPAWCPPPTTAPEIALRTAMIAWASERGSDDDVTQILVAVLAHLGEPKVLRRIAHGAGYTKQAAREKRAIVASVQEGVKRRLSWSGPKGLAVRVATAICTTSLRHEITMYPWASDAPPPITDCATKIEHWWTTRKAQRADAVALLVTALEALGVTAKRANAIFSEL